jgi:hypothetical protein
MEHIVPLHELFEGNLDLEQTVLDHINDYREPSTPSYESLAEVSDARILYWVQYNIARLSEQRQLTVREQPFGYRPGEGVDLDELAERYRKIDWTLTAHGVKPTSEGWGYIRFGCVTDHGIFNLRDTK